MAMHAANTVRTADALKVLQWFKARLLGGPHFGALLSALHTAVFLGFSYVGLTLVTGWAQQVWATLRFAERQ